MTKSFSYSLCVLALVMLLTSCSAKHKDIPTLEPSVATTTTASSTETVPTETAMQNPSLDFRLAEAEALHAKLQDRIINDASLSQADMNDLAGQQYTLWDTLLNELWAELTHTLPQVQMQQLLQEERAWIRWKEHSLALVSDYYGGGSLSILATDLRAAKLTQDRVYELAEILARGVYPIPQTESELYRQVFLPLAASQQLDYENLQLLLEFRGLTLTEDDGIIEIRVPQFPETSVFAILSNESGKITIPQLGYSITSSTTQKCVRVDFFPTPPTFYIDAAIWDDGKEVSSLEELTDYLCSISD